MNGFVRWLNKAVDCVLRTPAGQAHAISAGEAGERLAAEFLRQRGLNILAANHRCKGGEIDLVADEHGTIVFVEVRLRSQSRFGGAAASITPQKRARIERAARHWLNHAGSRWQRAPCRFDAILLDRLDPERCEWLRNAFPARNPR